MKIFTAVISIILGLIASTVPGDAFAADGAICYSDTVTITYPTTTPNTVNYPQIGSNHVFYCPGGSFSFRQLSQAGWIIEQLGQVLVQSSVSATGVATQKMRWQITIQR